jgi:protein TonB
MMNLKSVAIVKSPIVPAAGASLVFSLLLFGLLYSVIRAGHHALEKMENLPTIDFVRLKHDTEVESLSRHKPPPPPAQPPPPAKMKIASDTVAQQGLALDVPSLNLKADLGGGMMGGNKGSAAAMFDGEIIPLQCPPITYPSDARRAGLNGWVLIEFVVGPDGSVRSARAVDAQPRGVFEAAAVMGAQRCKFKPKMEDGVAKEQKGRRKFNFNLNTGAG